MLMALMVSDMLTVMVLMDTDTPMLMLDTITAKDPLSPPLLLNLDMVMVMLTDTDTVTVTVMLLMPTMVTVMVMVTVTVMAILMASKFILLSFLSNYYNGCVYKKFYMIRRILICDPQYLKLSL